MQRSTTKVNRLDFGGDSVTVHLSAQARRKRKRLLSKRRRARIKAEDSKIEPRT